MKKQLGQQQNENYILNNYYPSDHWSHSVIVEGYCKLKQVYKPHYKAISGLNWSKQVTAV